MHNEVAMAEYLRERRGFRIVDVTRDDVPTIVAACAGARIIAGIEGSQIVHGLMVLERGSAVLTLQPPNRFCSVIKRTTDMAGMNYGFVVGQQNAGGFLVDPAEVERTLDLFPQAPDIVSAGHAAQASRQAKDRMTSHGSGKEREVVTAH
jgi:capsular polysaccharide biosynthesis protein